MTDYINYPRQPFNYPTRGKKGYILWYHIQGKMCTIIGWRLTTFWWWTYTQNPRQVREGTWAYPEWLRRVGDQCGRVANTLFAYGIQCDIKSDYIKFQAQGWYWTSTGWIKTEPHD